MAINTEIKHSPSVPLAVSTGASKHKPSSILFAAIKHTVEFIALSVIAILLVEGIFRLGGIGQQEYLQADPVLGCRHIPNQLVTWRLEGYSSDRLSSAGLRDVEHTIAKPYGIKRIALLGDSSTEGLQVPLSNTYAKKLEKELNAGNSHQRYETINFACSGYSTGQEYVQFKKDVEQYKPDVTVVLYNCGDAQENVRDPNKVDVEPRPYFYLDGKGNLQQDNLLLKKIQQQAGRQIGSRTDGKTNGDYSVVEFLQHNSRIYDVLKQADLMLSINEKTYRKLRSAICSMVAATTGSAKAAQGYKAQYSRQGGLKVSEKLLQALNNECKQAHSRFAIALFPNTNNNSLYAGEQKELHTFAAQNKLEMLDLTSAFLSAANSGDLFLQYHFSSRGHKLVADQLAALVK